MSERREGDRGGIGSSMSSYSNASCSCGVPSAETNNSCFSSVPLRPCRLRMGWRFKDDDVEEQFVVQARFKDTGLFQPTIEVANAIAGLIKFWSLLGNLELFCVMYAIFCSIASCFTTSQILRPSRLTVLWILFSTKGLSLGPGITVLWTVWFTFRAAYAAYRQEQSSLEQSMAILAGTLFGCVHVFINRGMSAQYFAVVWMVALMACAAGSIGEYQRRLTFWGCLQQDGKRVSKSVQAVTGDGVRRGSKAAQTSKLAVPEAACTVMVPGSAAWTTAIGLLLQAVFETNWDKKPWHEMRDLEIWALQHLVKKCPLDSSSSEFGTFRVDVAIPGADPCLLPDDAADSLAHGLRWMFPGLHVVRTNFHPGSLLVSITLWQNGARGAGDARRGVLLRQPRQWLQWLRLPDGLGSGLHVSVDYDKVADRISSCLPYVVSADHLQLCDSETTSNSLVFPLACTFDPDSVLIRAALGTASLPVHIVSEQGGTSLCVEGIHADSLKSRCQVMVISNYRPTTRAVFGSRDVMIVPHTWVVEQQEVNRLVAEAPNLHVSAAQSEQRSKLDLALSWAWWLDRSHTLRVASAQHLDGQGSATSGAQAAEDLSAHIKRGAGLMKKLVSVSCPAMAEQLLKFLVLLRGTWALSDACEINRNYGLLHNAALSASPAAMDQVLGWIHQHQLDCSWTHQNSRGHTALHVAILCRPECGMLQHLLSKQDPCVESVWQGEGQASGPQLQLLAQRIERLRHVVQHARTPPPKQPSPRKSALSQRLSASLSRTSGSASQLWQRPAKPAANGCADDAGQESPSVTSVLSSYTRSSVSNSNIVPLCCYLDWRLVSSELEEKFIAERKSSYRQHAAFRAYLELVVLLCVFLKHMEILNMADQCLLMAIVASVLLQRDSTFTRLYRHGRILRVSLSYMLWGLVPLLEHPYITIVMSAWLPLAAAHTQLQECSISPWLRAVTCISGCLVGSVRLMLRINAVPVNELVCTWSVVLLTCVSTSLANLYKRHLLAHEEHECTGARK